MVYARLQPSGRLTDIRRCDRAQYLEDVELLAFPSGDGPWLYDSTTKLAVLDTSITLADRINTVRLDSSILKAVALRLSASWPGTSDVKKTWAQSTIDEFGKRLVKGMNGA